MPTTVGKLKMFAAVASMLGATATAAPAQTWSHQDIGAVGLAGNATANDGAWTVQGAGADIWGGADAFHFVYRPLAGDGEITARVEAMQNTGAFAKAGIRWQLHARRAGILVRAARERLAERPLGDLHVELGQEPGNGFG